MISNFSVTPLSMINIDGHQRVILRCESKKSVHATLYVNGESVNIQKKIGLSSGKNCIALYLEPPKKDTDTIWKLEVGEAEESISVLWKKPREWEFFVMVSSHTDIGLHNSQYIQRYNSSRFVDMAAELCDSTAERDPHGQYRYTMEGSWFWNNYPNDRGEEAARNIVDKYIKTGKLGVGAGIAGNHFHSFGFEEMCRSAYGRKQMYDKWGIDTHTMCMMDINGMPWSMIQPYADAGYRNIIFAPNQWNPPHHSRIWNLDAYLPVHIKRSDINGDPSFGGGGSRIDVRYDSALPMLFFWRSPDDQKELLVWGSTQYSFGGLMFGLAADDKNTYNTLRNMDVRFSEMLPEMEAKYPYDVWMFACYDDDQTPDGSLTDIIDAWNRRWKYPKIRTMGNPDLPFDLVRERYGSQIPVLKGEITGGWYQHPCAAAEILANKLETDRRLANAQTYASLAAVSSDYTYPAQEFNRAWDALLWNDEHSYGTSGYKGQGVYETWIQHRDWVEKASETAKRETKAAVSSLAEKIPGEGYAIFNPTSRERSERIVIGDKECVVSNIPPCGYKTVKENQFKEVITETTETDIPPVVENNFYKVIFSDNGSMSSIYDKSLRRELLSQAGYGANTFLFTNDNHKTFFAPKKACFTVKVSSDVIVVVVKTQEEVSGADIVQTITLDNLHRRIDIQNELTHVRAMMNNKRYMRYIYYAFPFDVENAKRICQMNGCQAEYAVDLTGHSTDTYMSAHEWCSVENKEFGVGLMQLDSLLVEFDHIHPDKTDFGDVGEGSAVYSYVANDWLQMHQVGGSYVNYKIRYSITSWETGEKDIEKVAELVANPVELCGLKNGAGLPALSHSFLTVPNGQRLIDIKRAEDGNGLIARLLGQRNNATVVYGDGSISISNNTVDEMNTNEELEGNGFTTLRIELDQISKREDTPDLINEDKPAPIGSVYTGLITKPKAARGEADNLYLLWGQNMEKNLSHYELYRSENEGFIPSDDNFIANVEPGVYRVVSFQDRGLNLNTRYYYRVRAVNNNGVSSEFSDEFSALTRELVE